MHYKDGTPANLGDIIQHDSGHVGIVIGGQVGNDYCTTQVVLFRSAAKPTTYPQAMGPGYVGQLREADGALKAIAAVTVGFESSMQTREMIKIGHVDIGHG